MAYSAAVQAGDAAFFLPENREERFEPYWTENNSAAACQIFELFRVYIRLCIVVGYRYGYDLTVMFDCRFAYTADYLAADVLAYWVAGEWKIGTWKKIIIKIKNIRTGVTMMKDTTLVVP